MGLGGERREKREEREKRERGEEKRRGEEEVREETNTSSKRRKRKEPIHTHGYVEWKDVS